MRLKIYITWSVTWSIIYKYNEQFINFTVMVLPTFCLHQLKHLVKE